MDATAAIRLQELWAAKVIREDRPGRIKYVAGVDAAYYTQNKMQFAATVVLDADSLEIEDVAVYRKSVGFPYIPGLFSFRELPAILQAMERLSTTPDLIVCDGQGIAHPRRFGLASHLGVALNIPTIGCSKSRLIGKAAQPGPKRGDSTLLTHRKEIIGSVLRTQHNTNPLYVSIGHLITLKTACDWILRLSPKYRLPETTRQADRIVRKYSKDPLAMVHGCTTENCWL